VLPVYQSAYISDLPCSPAALLAIATMLAAAAWGGLVAWRRGEREVAFLLLWMGCTLAPSLAIVIKIPAAPVAERYLYLPSVGYCLLLAYGIMRAYAAIGSRNARTVLAATVVVLLCVGAAATLRRNAVWRSNLTLWEDTAAKNLTDGLPMRSLATAYQQLGDTARAGEYFRLALQRRNDALGLFTINNNLGSLAMMEKKLDEAERYYRAALASNPQAADTLFNLGLIGLTRAKNEDATHDASWRHDQAVQARQLFQQAQQLSPLDPEIPVGLGQALSVLGDSAGARIQFQRALQLGLPPETDAAVRKLLGELP
jgi:tetratricopeptide (TPR) repeat protein